MQVDGESRVEVDSWFRNRLFCGFALFAIAADKKI